MWRAFFILSIAILGASLIKHSYSGVVNIRKSYALARRAFVITFFVGRGVGWVGGGWGGIKFRSLCSMCVWGAAAARNYKEFHTHAGINSYSYSE